MSSEQQLVQGFGDAVAGNEHAGSALESDANDSMNLAGDRHAMIIVREFHDVARELVDYLKETLPAGDPRIEEACSISNGIHRLGVRVLGGICNAAAVTAPKRYMSR